MINVLLVLGTCQTVRYKEEHGNHFQGGETRTKVDQKVFEEKQTHNEKR